MLELLAPVLFASTTADALGRIEVEVNLPVTTPGVTVGLQAVALSPCAVSSVVIQTF